MKNLAHDTRRALRLGTALATGIIGILQGQAAFAQNIPDNTMPTITNANATASGAVITTGGTLGTVDLTNGGTTVSRNLIWSDFSIGANNTVSFVATGDALTSLTALNNVTNGAPISVIEGQITSQSNVAVWLINPQGMLFSSGSSFSGGHLVLSTLPAVNAGDTANILDQSGGIDLGQAGGSASAFPGAITITAGASIIVTGTGAHVSLISQNINVAGSITSSGDVGLVLGHAVSLLSAQGSPLAYTIGAGTRLAAAKLVASGTISGANVRLAAITEDDVTGALLQVDSTAILTATANGGAVILSASNTNPGSASLVSNGTLQATNTNGSVSITADGTATVTGTVTTAGTGTYVVVGDTVTLGGVAARTQFGANGMSITATGGDVTTTSALTLSSDANIDIISDTDNALVHSAILAGGAYSVTGDSVTLGDGTAVLQQAAGAVTITARTGDLTTASGLSLISNGNTVALDSTSGNVQIGGKVVASGNINVTAQDDVRIAAYNLAGDTGYLSSVAGDVTIYAGGSVYGIGTLGTAAAILALQSGIDGYEATGSLTVNATGDVYAGTLSAGTNLILNVTGALLGSAGPTGTNVPGGAIFANGAGGDVSVTAAGGGGSVALNRVEAAGNVTIWGDQIAIGTLKSGIAPDLSDSNGDPLAPTDSYIGLLGVIGDYVVNFAGTPGVTTMVATENISALPAYGLEFFDNSFGKVNLNATTGNITGAVGYGAQLGTVTAGGYIDVDAGGIVANSVTSGTYVDLIATAGTLSLLDVDAGTTLTLDKQGGLLATPGDDLRIVDGTAGGTITATSSTSVRIGDISLAAILGNISVTATLGDISGLRTGTAAALGTVTTTTLLSTAYGSADFTANTGSVTLNAANGGIQAGDINLVGGAGDITASARALTLDLAVAQRDLNLTATLGTLYLGSGSIGRTALVTKNGGSIATVGDELRIGVLVGGTTTAPGGTTVTSSTHVRANTIDDGQSSVSITATAGDVVITERVFGTTNVNITAGRDFQITNYVGPAGPPSASGYVQSLGGNVTINAGGSVYGIGGSATDLPTTARGIDGYSSAGNLTVNATGDAHIGTLQAVGYIALNIGGGLFGTNGIGVDVPGGAVFANGAGGTVSVYANGAGGVNVLNRVEAAGNITLKGEEIAVGTPLPGGTLFLLDLGNNPLTASNYYVGLSTVPDGFIVNLTDPATITNMIALENTSGGVGTYAPEFFDNTVGKTDLDAGGRITGTVGAGAQLGTVSAGGFIDLTTGGIVADSVTAGGSINIVANTGTLSLLDVAASGGLTLTKNGGLITNPGDDLRVVTGTSTGGATLVSNTSIRVGDFTDTTGNIALTATNGDISGLLLGAHSALPTTTAGTALSNDWDKANLTATLGSVTVTAAAGSAQLGTLTAGTDVFADALALTADSVVAGGSIDLAVTSGTLFLGSGTAGLNATLDKTGLDDELRVLTLSSGLAVGGASGVATVNSATNIRAQTVTAYGGSAQLTAFNGEITGITGVNSGRVNVFAREDLAAGNAPIAGTDLNAYLFGGTLIRAGTVEGGENALTYANILSPALRSAQVDVTSIHARRGAAFAAVDNSVAGLPNGIQFGSIISDGGIAGAVALGTNSGNVVGTTVQGFTGVRLVSAAGAVNIGTAIAGNGTLGGTADATIDAFSDVNVTTLTAGATAAVLARNGSITVGTTLAGEDAAFSASQSAILTSVSARDDVAITAANARIGSASAVGGVAGIDARDVDFTTNISIGAATNTGSNLAVTATTGDISGLLTGTPGALPITTGATQLSANYGRANLTATAGTITVTAAGGGAQLGTLVAGTNVVADALALTADSVVAGGSIDLAVTSGTLYLGSGSAGLSASLEKTGAGDELRFGTLVTGATPGGATADATVRSSTNIRGTSIIARSGAILVEALNGQVTGLAGGRLALSALGDLDATPLSDLGITVNTGGLARLGDLQAGADILITAENFLTPPTFGEIDILSATSARGDVRLTAGASIRAGQLTSTTSSVTLRANGGDITGLGGFSGIAANRPDILAAGAVLITSTGSTQLDTAQAGTSLTVTAGTATSDGKIDINTATASGAIMLDAFATNPAADANHDGGVRVGTANAGTTLTLTNVARGAGIGDITIGILATSGSDAFIDAADNARIAQATVTNTLAIRAGDEISGLTAGSAANFTAGEDLALYSGAAVNLANATAGDDLIIESASTITAGALSVSGSGPDLRSIRFASPTAITIVASAANGASIELRSSGGSVNTTGLLSATGSVTIDAADGASVTGGVTAGGNYSVTAVNAIQLGGAGATTQVANGAVTIRSTGTSPSSQVTQGGGLLTLTANFDGAGAEALTITAPGGITLGNAALSGASIGLISSGGSVTSAGTLTSVGDITVNAGNQANVTGAVTAGGNYSVTAANAIQLGGAGATTQSASGAVTITSTGTGPTSQVTQGGGALTLRANSDGVGTEALSITAAGGITLGTTSLIGGDGGRQSAIALAASGGQITIGTASGARLGVTAQTGFTANGAITAGNDTLLADPAGGPATVDIAVAAGGITTDAITVTGIGHDIRLAASGAIATGALNAARSVTASGTTAGSSATSFTAPSITATSGAIDVTAGSIAVAGAQTAGTTIDLDATNGTLQIGAITAPGGDVSLAATGTATLNGVINASGHNVDLAASNAEIGGDITANRITIVHNGGAGNPLRIGSNSGGIDGFVLDQTEFNHLKAPTLVLDAGSVNDVAIGSLTISNAVVGTLDIYGLQRIDLTGNLTSNLTVNPADPNNLPTSTLTRLQLGGTVAATNLASMLRIAANADGTGGRIDIGTGALDLRAAIIGVGQDSGFLDLLGVTPGTTLRVDPRLMVSNDVQRGLYNSMEAGGQAYVAGVRPGVDGRQLIRASSMTVTYSNFALFQNTGPRGENSGVVLGSTNMPAAPALHLIGFGPTQAGPFAIFGQINGRGGIAAALLGDSINRVNNVDRNGARINGCLIGSSAGCLSSLLLTPALGTFDPVRGDIFYAEADFELPFDPLVGTNNDTLFGDVGTFGLSDIPLEPIECDKATDATCVLPDKDSK